MRAAWVLVAVSACGRVGFEASVRGDGAASGDRGDASGASYRKTITIDHAQLTSSGAPALADFPLLVSVIDPDLRAVANGGHVASALGYDLRFEADPASCAAPPCLLAHEIERYDPSTGELVGWVRVPSVATAAAGADTVITLAYGDASITSPTADPPAVWDASFVGVWHMSEDPTGVAPQIHDSTSYANHGSALGTWTASGDVEAVSAGGLAFDGATESISIPDAPSLDIGSGVDMTISLWARSTQGTGNNSFPELVNKDPGQMPRSGFSIALHADQQTPIYGEIYASGTEGSLTGVDVADGAWHAVALVRSGSTLAIYTDGVETSGATSVTTRSLASPYPLSFGRQSANGNYPFAGDEDEVRISTTARSADWLFAEYESAAMPAALCSFSGEMTIAP